MANVFIIHGAYGSPEENWIPWLKNELEKLGHTVFVPRFPTPEGQSLESWRNAFKEYEQYLDEKTVVIGHSLGPLFLLDVLERIDCQIKAAFFISTVLKFIGNPAFDEINKTFILRKINWDLIKKHCKDFYVYHSDNDSYVPLNYSKELAEKLGVQVNVVKNAGHFNEKAGYKKFDLLLEKIKIVI